MAAGVVIGANLDAARALGAALVRGIRTARREGAAGRQPHERGRVALDGHQAVLGRHVGLGHGAEKAHGVGLRRTLEQRIDARTLHRTTGVHDHHVICRAGNNAQVVRDKHDGGTGLLLRDLQDV